MKTLIIKLGAAGDVVRTTPLLRGLPGEITWITSGTNHSLVDGIASNAAVLSWEEYEAALNTVYDLVISLEDAVQVGQFVSDLQFKRLFGASIDADSGQMRYSDDASPWFDLSLISRYGREEANRLKFLNRRSYQDFLFKGLGLCFCGERYLLPKSISSGLQGDVAISPNAGQVWPMKAWAYYRELQRELENQGLKVNVLPLRSTLLEHIGDIQGHRCLVSGDSLPMHLALGSGVPCVSIFNCTSPWEIHGYGIQTKLISPLLEQHFYQRDFDPAATTAVPLETVFDAVWEMLQHGKQLSGAIC